MTDGTRRTKAGRIKLVPPLAGWMIEYHGVDTENFDSYWSNEQGWVDKPDADTFSDAERETKNLPFDGHWVSVQELHESRVTSMNSHPSGPASRAHLIPIEGGKSANE